MALPGASFLISLLISIVSVWYILSFQNSKNEAAKSILKLIKSNHDALGSKFDTVKSNYEEFSKELKGTKTHYDSFLKKMDDFQSSLKRIERLQEERSSGCKNSRKDSNGVICINDEAWDRILREDDLIWRRINESLEIDRDSDGSLNRRNYPRFIEDEVKYKEARRDYLLSIWIPTISCPEENRIGNLGDGAKWVCGARNIAANHQSDDKCLIYSFGCSDKFDFEVGMHDLVQQSNVKCDTLIFDPNADMAHWHIPTMSNINLYPIGLKEEGQIREHYQTYDELLKKFGHEKSPVDILKIDIEGSEFKVLPEIISKKEFLPNQILIEMHLPKPPHVGAKEGDEVLLALRNAGYSMFHTEANYDDPQKCNEYSFIRIGSRTYLDK